MTPETILTVGSVVAAVSALAAAASSLLRPKPSEHTRYLIEREDGSKIHLDPGDATTEEVKNLIIAFQSDSGTTVSASNASRRSARAS